MSESAIENELLEVTAFKLKKVEDRQVYLTRLMRAVSKLPDPEWEGLSVAAQDWNNGAAEAYQAGDKLGDFPDLIEGDEEADEQPDEAVEEVEQVKPTKAAKDETKKKELVDNPPAYRPATNTSPGRKVSACHTIKRMVVKKPDITVAEISEQLKEHGFKVSDVTISTLRSDLRDTLRVLNETGVAKFAL